MRSALFALAILAATTSWSQVQRPFTSDESYRLERTRVQNEYATAKERCTSVKGHQREICRAEADAHYNVARAELRARHKPGPKTEARLQRARADAQLQLATARCGDMTHSAKDVCLEEAKARRKLAASESGERTARAGGLNPLESLTALAKPRESRTPRCDALSGERKQACLRDAAKPSAQP